MKKLLCLVLSILMAISCGVVALADDVPDVAAQLVIDGIDTFMTISDPVNSCDFRMSGDLEVVANVNSGAWMFSEETELFTEGAGAGCYSKKSADEADIPMIVRCSQLYAVAYDFLEFDLYVSADMTLGTTWGNVNFQGNNTNSCDEQSVFKVGIMSTMENIKAGQWNAVRIPMPVDMPYPDSPFCQICIRYGHGCFNGPVGAYLILDNVRMTAYEDRPVEMSDEAGLLNLKSDYDALTEAQKATVTNYSVLEGWLAELNALKAELQVEADKVDALIDALPAPADVATEHEEAIKAARKAFDDLEYEVRKLVKGKDKLEAVEEAFDALVIEPPAPQNKRGDVNGDDAVDATDALLVLKYAVDKADLTEDQKVIADLDKDGNINAADALIILKIAVNKA